jgi:hypothetical protein
MPLVNLVIVLIAAVVISVGVWVLQATGLWAPGYEFQDFRLDLIRSVRPALFSRPE